VKQAIGQARGLWSSTRGLHDFHILNRPKAERKHDFKGSVEKQGLFCMPGNCSAISRRDVGNISDLRSTEINFEEYRKSDKLKAWKNYTSWQSILRR